VPATQLVHADAATAEYWPAIQLVHPEEEESPVDAEKVPAAQFEQEAEESVEE